MAKIQVVAPDGARFRIGGKLITDDKPVTVHTELHRIRKALSDGSIVPYEKAPKQAPKQEEPVSGGNAQEKGSVDSIVDSLFDGDDEDGGDKPKGRKRKQRKK